MRSVESLSDFQTQVRGGEKYYLLLANSKNEKGQCAINSITTAQKSIEGLKIYFADLSKVRDIHPYYNISSAPSLLEFNEKELKNIIKGCNSENFYKMLFQEIIFRTKNKNEQATTNRVTVYSTPTCSWCTTLKNYLNQHNVQFSDIDVSVNQKAADDMVKRSGQMGVPQIDINGEIIVGFNQSRINQLLKINP